MISHSTSRALPCLGLVAALACGGCGVLTVDVDVYKGPLANHEDVQMEQMAAIAIGAKPLLVHLRDVLEWGDCARASRRRFRETDQYDFGYMTEAQHRFDDFYADRVNAILYLYDDRARGALHSTLMEGLGHLEDYKRADRVFRLDGAGKKDAQELWKRTAGKLDPKELLTGHPALRGVTQKRDELAVRVRELREAYRKLILREPRAAKEDWPNKQVFQAHARIVEIRKTAKPRMKIEQVTGKVEEILEVLSLPSSVRKRWPALIGSNAHFKALEDPRIVDAHAEILFGGKDSRERQDFVAEVVKIAKSFAAQRKALHNLLRTTLRFIRQFDSERYRGHAQRGYILSITAELAVTLLQYIQLGGVLEAARKRPDLMPKEVRELAATLGTGSRPVLKERLCQELTGDHPRPGRAANALLLADGLFRSKHFDAPEVLVAAFPVTVKDNADKRWQYALPAKRRYGLARGAQTNVPEEVFEAARHMGKLQAIIQAGGLEGGRLDKGLEHLIGDYLNAAAGGDPKDVEVRSRRNILLAALARFAEKVLFIANCEKLMAGKEMRPPEEMKRYVLALQAVGNSILVGADELRHRKEHTDKLEGRGRRERKGYSDAVAGRKGAPDRIKNMPVEKDDRDPRHVLDMLIAVYRREHMAAEAAGDRKRANAYARALQAAFLHRSAMVYIRPSSAYLRSSYPATALQAGPSTEWYNMLAEHGLRQLPFAQLLFRTRDAEIQREIDKQFWQNINRVRVAGAGLTNYVVAKDDVGNWYVKQYSSDPKDIIQSAAALASLGLRGGLDAHALKALKDQAGLKEPLAVAGASDTGDPRPVLLYPGQAESFRRLFDEESRTLLTEIREWCDGVDRHVGKAWDAPKWGDKNDDPVKEKPRADLVTAMKGVTEAEKLAEAVDPKAKDPSAETLRALEAMVKYRNALSAAVSKRKEEIRKDTDKVAWVPEYDKADMRAKVTIDRKLSQVIAQRRQILSRHRERLRVIAGSL